MVERSFGLKSSKFNSKYVVGGGSSEIEPKPFSACRNPHVKNMIAMDKLSVKPHLEEVDKIKEILH